MELSTKNVKIRIPVEVEHARSAGIERSHGFQKKLVRVVLIAVIALASVHAVQVPQAAAGSISTVIRVSAVVLARSQLKALRQPAMLVVTEADVQRGYVEVSGASFYEIWNNSPAGCVLTLDSNGFPFREAVVTVMGREIIINPTGGIIVIPITGRREIALDYRFVLAGGAQPGTYAWPFSLTVNPR